MNALFVSLLCAVLAFAAVNAAPSEDKEASNETVSTQPDVDQTLWDYVNAYKRIMPCGDSSLGLPVLAPFRAGNVEIAVDDELLTMKGSVNNLVIEGLNKFVVINLAYNSSNNRTEFDMLYKGLDILGEFDIDVNADLAGFRYIQNWKGLTNFQLRNMRINGGMTMSSNQNGGTTFSDLDYFIQIGDIVSYGLDYKWSVAVNNFVNQYISDAGLLFVQTNREFISQSISNWVTPMMNNVFQNISSSEFLQAIAETTELYKNIECSP